MRARPCDVAWIRSIKDQCQTSDVPVFVKQLGAKPYTTDNQLTTRTAFGIKGAADLRYLVNRNDKKGGDPSPDDLRVREFPR